MDAGTLKAPTGRSGEWWDNIQRTNFAESTIFVAKFGCLLKNGTQVQFFPLGYRRNVHPIVIAAPPIA